MKGPLQGFTVGLQIRLPEGWDTDPAFAARLTGLAEAGYGAVELNILEPDAVDPRALRAFLARFGLRMTAFASGLTAKTLGLALSHDDEDRRRVSVSHGRRFLAFAAAMEAAVIVGFFKGGPGARREPFARSLRELAPEAARLGVPLIIEATNRYESGLCNAVADTLSILDEVESDALRILPDTYHMNIEETGIAAALANALPRCASVHLSDNNRRLPGFGAIDFAPIVRLLRAKDFKGVVALEGNMPGGVEADARAAARYLEALPA